MRPFNIAARWKWTRQVMREILAGCAKYPRLELKNHTCLPINNGVLSFRSENTCGGWRIVATITEMDNSQSKTLSLVRDLSKCPVRDVFVCDRKIHPPIFSHVVNFPRLEIPLRGCYENHIESEGRVITVRLRPGDALFAPPNCWNLPSWRLKVDLISMLFGKKHVGISLVSGRGPDVPQLAAQKFSFPWPLTGPLSLILDAMVELQSAGEPREAFVNLSQALLLCVRELLQRPQAESARRAHGLLEAVCVYLQNNYQYDITRNFVAQQFNVTPNHISRLFQTHGSMSFSNYLMHVRVDRAKHLLRSYDLKLDDIAIRCGYRDTPYFCRVFKRLTKVTPAEYRGNSRPSLTEE